MESNKNDNNNGDNEHQQPQRTAQKRKLNQLTNDEEPAEAAGQEDQDFTNSKKNREEGNDLLDLELESLSREELINLVRKRIAMTMETEAQKQLETAKKEAEERTKQAEEFSQRIVQLEQEKAEVHEDLDKKMVEIGEMHKEMEEKSEKLAEKANQIEALLVQLNESTSHQHQIPTEQEMKIQLSLETWFDWLGFVPRHRLGQIVPQIGDRRFASIVQKFLHEYGEITIGCNEIVAPYEEDPIGHPRVRAWQIYRFLRFEMAEAHMPANIKSFYKLELSYFDQSVLNFMQKFQHNGLLDNVTLWYSCVLSKDIVQPVLCHILPLINGIKSVFAYSAQLVDIYDAGNSKEIYELNMKMMEQTRFLTIRNNFDPQNLQPNKIDLYCRWLYLTTRADGKPRVLQFGRMDVDYSPIYLFIDRIKQDFLMATHPVTFFIRINLPKAFQPQQQDGISLDNCKTKERLVTKIEEADPKVEGWEEVVLLISRYSLASTKKWIVENEKEVLNWDFNAQNGRIYLSEDLKVVAI